MATRRAEYYPGTEPLAVDAMRITAIGTGRPFLRRAQANTCWLVELGNGDIFMFDFGAGSQMNFTALDINYGDVTAYFASHLHVDHVGDFPSLFAGSWTAGRHKPLEIYGPSGQIKEHGMKHFIECQLQSLAWDRDTRLGILPRDGAKVNVHEFDYSKPHVIYEQNGVSVFSFPAVHILDGAVSFRLEWNGLVFVFSGDTVPNTFMLEHGQNADLLVHEAMNTVAQIMRLSGMDEKTATKVGAASHTQPVAIGPVLSRLKPRHAVLFHHFNDVLALPEIHGDVRKSFFGPLTLAQDFMVFDVTGEDISVRMACVTDYALPNQSKFEGFRDAPRGEKAPMSEWLAASRLDPR